MLKKIFLCVIFTIILSFSLCAQTPGTTADPLVSKSYVDKFLKFREVSFKNGSTIQLNCGCMFILISGKAKFEAKKGTGLIDLTSGLALKNGKQIAVNRLYIAGENENGIIKIEKDSKALVLGINESNN